LALSLPLAAYVVQQPGALLQRPNEVSRTDLNALVGAIQAWAGAWLSRGDIFHNHNIPGRPLLDWASAALVLLGIAQLAWLRRYRKAGAALAGLALISILPSLLSETPPHFLRSIGLTVPVTLVMGAGAEGIVSFGTRLSRAASNLRHAQAVLGVGARLAPVALFAAVATKTYVDFHGTWLRLPELETQFERRVLQATEVLRQNSRETPSGTPVYFVQKGLWHPIVRFSQYRLPMFRVAAFEMPTCLAVSAEREGIYVDLSLTRKALVHALSAWGEVAAFHPSQPDLLRFLPDRAALLAEGDAQAQFGAQVEVRAHPADLPARVSPGARLSWLMRFRLHQPTSKAYALFVHLYKIDPSGEVDDTHKFAQGDRWLCPPYPTPFWQPDEVVVQPFELTLPDDLPAGDYAIAVGVYDQASGERLTLPGWKSYFVLHRLSVVR
ncbi:MAG: hypothetical protein RMM31_09340, partial [Anaerolineae bacterium]|nr:hypothetical protein [Anaerolineae bacterium]